MKTQKGIGVSSVVLLFFFVMSLLHIVNPGSSAHAVDRLMINPDRLQEIRPQPSQTQPLEQKRDTAPTDQAKTKDQFCKDYATTALEAWKENESRKCGYSGEGWGSDYQSHYVWCIMGSNSDLVPAKIKSLREALEKCRTCEQYANTAVSQNKVNVGQSCGYKGPAWDSDYNNHFKWCMAGQNVQFTGQETKKRQGMMDQCKPLFGSFNIQSIKPYLNTNSYLDHVDIQIEANSTKPWAIGPYGPGDEGSLWLKLRVYNLNDKCRKTVTERIFSITGKSGGNFVNTFMAPPMGMSFPAGNQNFTATVSSGYPNIRVEACKDLYHTSGLFQPGGYACDFFFPDIDATVYMVTNTGVKSDTKKIEEFMHPNIFFNRVFEKGSAPNITHDAPYPCP